MNAYRAVTNPHLLRLVGIAVFYLVLVFAAFAVWHWLGIAVALFFGAAALVGVRRRDR